MIKTAKITVHSSGNVPDFIDITPQIDQKIKESGVLNGQVLVFSQHTTAAVVIQEKEDGIYEDIKETLTNIAPMDKDYKHHRAALNIPDEPLNGYAHCHHVLLGPSELIPVFEGKLQLGTYQHIYLVELDRARERNVIVQVMGD